MYIFQKIYKNCFISPMFLLDEATVALLGQKALDSNYAADSLQVTSL